MPTLFYFFRKKPYFLLLILFIEINAVIAQHQLPEGFSEKLIADKLNPVAMAIAPDGRIFITEKNGKVLIIRDDKLVTTPFITFNNIDDFNERGLSGIAFHPDFENNPYIYFYYTLKDANHNRIVRVKANGDVAIPGTEEVLMELNQLSGTIHNAGAMAFGNDGKLYISVGDGSNAANAQNMNTTLGKFLRINPDGTIPQDNPFYHTATGNNRAIWSLGFRNSFTFDIQPGTGRIFACEVGGGAYEEINEIIKGKNYGWSTIEGPKNNQTAPPDYKDPVYYYPHSLGCAIVGAAFYNPEHSHFPANYVGKFFFADYCNGYIKVLNPDNGTVESTFATQINRPLTFKFDHHGNMYYIERAGMGGGSMEDNTNTNNGALWKVEYTGTGTPSISQNPASELAAVGDDVSFFVAASGTRPLSYQWYRDGNLIPEATSFTYTVENISLTDHGAKFHCVVTNSFGNAPSEEATLSVTTNTRPVPVINTPTEGVKYIAGNQISFSGSATDAEDGALSNSALTWWIDFHHDEHKHPGLSAQTGISSGQFTVPKYGEISPNVWYRIHLKATDSEGFSKTVYRDIYPELTTLKVLSDPTGIEMNIDGATLSTPQEFESVQGITRNIEAPVSYISPDSLYTFKQWSTGSTNRLLTFDTPAKDSTFKAIYNRTKLGNGTGLYAKYYNTTTRNLSGLPTLSRTDATINFDWGGGSPDPLINNNNFTAQWTGTIVPLFSEEYTFYVASDDGIRLWINNQQIIDKWIPQGTTEWQGKIQLTAGQEYYIRLDYFEDAGAAVVKMYWSSPSNSKQIIPKSQLFPHLIVTDLEDEWEKKGMLIYPNPVGESLRIKLYTDKTEKVQIRITNNLWQKLTFKELQLNPGWNEAELNTGSLPAGMYFLEVKKDKKNFVKIFVKQ